MNPVLINEAEEELMEAVMWYESREPGLGKRFRDEIAYVLNRIAESPLLWRERPGDTGESTALSFLIIFRTSYEEKK